MAVKAYCLKLHGINKKFFLNITEIFIDGPTWVRTRDLPVMSRWLFQLSYRPALKNIFYNYLDCGFAWSLSSKYENGPFLNGNQRPTKNEIWVRRSFQIGNVQFLTSSRKSRSWAEAYDSTSHNQLRRLTTKLRKRTISGWKQGV